MSMTRPWTPGVPIWDCLDAELGHAIRENFEERAAIMEFHGRGGPVSSEQRAYAWIIEALWDANKIPHEALEKSNVIAQIDRAAIMHRMTKRQLALGMHP